MNIGHTGRVPAHTEALVPYIAIIGIYLLLCSRAVPGQTMESILDRKISDQETILKELPKVPRLCDSMNAEKSRIDVGGCALYCEREGQGTPIVLLHGGPGATHHCFHPSFSRAAAFAQVIYYDQRGCGISDYSPGGGYTVDQAVDDLENLRKALGFGKWVVLGHSYGGLLAQCYVTKYPDNVAALVLVCAQPGEHYFGKSRQTEFMLPQELQAIRKVKQDTSLTVAQSIYNAFLNGDWKRQYFYKPSKERIAQMAFYEWNHDEGFNARMSGNAHRIDLHGVFDSCPIPTLILEGKWDLTWDEAKAGFMHETHPGSTLVMFEHASHEPFDDEPDKFFDNLKGFVAELKTPSDSEMAKWKAQLKGRENSLATLLQIIGWGRTSSETIAKAYSPEALSQLTTTMQTLRVGFALYDAKRYEDARNVFKKMEDLAAGYDKSSAGVAMVWQGHMLDVLGKRDEAVAMYKKAADLHIHYAVRHDQYGIVCEFPGYPEHRMKRPFTRVENTDPD